MNRPLALAALALLACACTRKPPPAAQDLQLGSGQFPSIASVETLAEVGDDADTLPGEAAALRTAGLSSAARYRYHLRGPDGGVVKVHVALFASEAAAIADYQTRHRPEALAQTRPLALAGAGEGWIYPNAEKGEMAGLRAGRVVVEMRARGAGSQLAPFSLALARQAQQVLAR